MALVKVMPVAEVARLKGEHASLKLAARSQARGGGGTHQGGHVLGDPHRL
jgi:hypothetical protein